MLPQEKILPIGPEGSRSPEQPPADSRDAELNSELVMSRFDCPQHPQANYGIDAICSPLQLFNLANPL